MRLIASWGSSGAGKTAVALALASALVKQKAEVLIIGADNRTPALPVYLPLTTALTGVNSLGSLLEKESITEANLKGRIHKHPKSEHLYCMGLISGELAGITYKPPLRAAVAGLMQLLQQSPFHYVIVDCDTNPIYDPLTLYALEQGDAVLRTTTPDVKGYECLKAQMAWLGNSDTFHLERHIKISNLVLPTTPAKDAAALFGGFDVSLPFASQVCEHFIAGELLTGFHSPIGIDFENRMTALAKRLDGDNNA